MNFKIANKNIGKNQPVFIVAEISANHGGSKEKALELIRAAKQAGADAVKIQTFTADTITLDCDSPDFLIDNGPWKNKKTLHALYDEAHTPWEWHQDLINEAKNIGIILFSSPFDLTAVDFLQKLKVPAYKIASPEITDIPLIKRVAKTKKPVIVSAGCATEDDIRLALTTLKKNGCKNIVLLKCTTSYPAPINEANLLTIPDMIKKFGVIAGLSDHTLGNTSVIASVALGGKFIEKHLVLDKNEQTVDAFFSLDENEFSQMVRLVRETEMALGKVSYDISPSAKPNLKWRRSLYVTKDIKKGEKFTKENVRSIRPAKGLHPQFYEKVLTKKASRDLPRGTALKKNYLR